MDMKKESLLRNHNRQKLLNAIIYFSKHTKRCGKTKLFKLLHFLDFIHFRETGKSVTGLDYYAWDKGPVPQDLFFEMENQEGDFRETIVLIKDSKDENDNLCKIIAKKPFDDKYFSKREIRIMERLAFIFKEALAKDIVEITHLPGQPWDRTIREKGPKKLIDYHLAIDGSKGSLTLEEIKERAADIREVERLFKNE